MRIVLITGLDGSGKSTLLSKLQANNIETVQIVNLPHINVEPLKPNKKLHKAALFVNKLNEDADVLKLPQLKAVALFASMILYSEIISLSEQDGAKLIFCERHPIIDTGIYARFYAEKLFPVSISKEILEKIDREYKQELEYLLSLLPQGIIEGKNGICVSFIAFIYQWFHVDKKYDFENLQKIFKVDFPNEIFYLQAKAELLFSRLKNRKILEAHESVEVFTKLEKAYQQLFERLINLKPNSVKIINANDINNLESLYVRLSNIKIN